VTPVAASPIIQFLGAARTVTGSRFLVDAEGSRVLIDCGLFQGNKELRVRNWSGLGADPHSIDAVVITHGHLDHVGYLPAMVRDGFEGPVFVTPNTHALASIVLADSARLQEEEAAYANAKGFSKHRPALPLYTQADAEAVEQLFRAVPFATPFEATASAAATFSPAGHILGSAVVHLHVAGRTLLFTGDLGRTSHPLLVPPSPPLDADVVVTESTYGDRTHEDREAAMGRLARVVSRTAERGGMVVIPSFAVDRTEVVLLALAELMAAKRIPRLPVYADSPMALAVLDVYRKAVEAGDPEIRPDVAGTDPFDSVLELHEAATTQESRALNDLRYPSIIVSASGMATGGRVLHHLARRLPDRHSAVVLPGFQAEGTRGRRLADGERAVKLLGRYVPVRADIVEIGAFSVHAGAGELISWLGHMPEPDVAFVVHGEPRAADALQDQLGEQLGWHAVVPALDERARID
jgi:metallo-beta-lactamase family protein